MQEKQLRRSATNQVIAGVCGGFGEYFEVDPTIVRIIFVIMALASGSGVFIYILLWLLIPGPTSTAISGEQTIKEGFQEMETKFDEVTHSVQESIDNKNQSISADTEQTTTSKTTNHEPQFWLGVILILLGGYFFLNNYGFFRFLDIGEFWPVILILIGAYYLMKKD